MYIIKEEQAKKIKEKFKLDGIAKEVGISKPYISLIFSGKKTCPKRTAYCIVKMINSTLEIEDIFNRVS